MGIKKFFLAPKRFFFPKNFKAEMQKGKVGSDVIVSIGMERVLKHSRGKFYHRLFSWLPLVGNFIFYMEGKRELKKTGRQIVTQQVSTSKARKRRKKSGKKHS